MITSKLYGILLLSVVALLVQIRAEAAGLQASLDRTRILEGETVLLTLSAPGDSWGIPELSALADDFEVNNQGQSTNMTIVNGRASSAREWQFLLAPKRTGSLTIPVLKIGDLSSEPMRLEVLPASNASQLGQTLPVMLEAELDKEAPYVQEQVVYKVRVLVRVSLQQASLEDPTAEGVIIERLGEDKSYESYRDGQRYKVIERRYALFPQHSGAIEIAPPVLSGGIPEPRRGRGGAGNQAFGGASASAFERLFGRDPFEDMGSLLQRTRPIQVRAPALALDVRPQPGGSSSPWLPAESLQLADTWAPDLSELRVGEPVTRTIAITTQGLTAAQLPDLLPDVPDSVKVYPDKPRTETRADGEDLVAVKEIKQALVPSVEGELTLPEVRLAWWDTQADRERVAVLPARVVQVLPARGGTASTSRPVTDPARAAAETDALPQPALPPRASVTESRSPHLGDELVRGLPFPAGYWPWISAGLALSWLWTLVLWLRERGRRGREQGVRAARLTKPPSPSLSAARSLVRRACEASDARGARDALLAWAAVCWPSAPPKRLESLADRFGGPAGESLRELDRNLYAAGSEIWGGPAAWERLKSALAQAEAERMDVAGVDAALPPLYPQRA